MTTLVAMELVRSDSDSKPPGSILFLLTGLSNRLNPLLLLSDWFSISAIKNPIVTNQNKGSAKPLLFFYLDGFSNCEKGL